MSANTVAGDKRPHLVIVGGGFAGLDLAKSLGGAPIRVTLIDKTNYHLFQPLLYQVATGGVSPGDISAPLRGVLRRHKNVRTILGEVVDVDMAARVVKLSDDEISFDYLVIAAGMTTSYFGNDQWQDRAPGMKTLEDAMQIRRRVLGAFEEAEREDDPARRRALLTFVVVGGGPTGVELAGALAELSCHTMKDDYRQISSADARIHLVEAFDRILPPFPEELATRATQDLQKLGVEVHVKTKVVDVRDGAVVLNKGAGDIELPTRTVLWGAGVQGSPLGRKVAAAAGVQADRRGRVPVNPNLTVGSHANLFVVGDLAAVTSTDGKPVPGVAPAAMQQGEFVGRLIKARLATKAEPTAFTYKDKGSLAVIGRNAAVAAMGKRRLTGFPAWVVWLIVHIMFLVEFENKVMVMTQWGWNYLTWKKGSLLITYGRPTLNGRVKPSSDDHGARLSEREPAPGMSSAPYAPATLTVPASPSAPVVSITVPAPKTPPSPPASGMTPARA